jgi:RND family efflux transporter MFP subunit
MKYTRTIPAIMMGALLIAGCSSKTAQNTTTVQSGADSARAVIPVKTMSLAKTKIARTVDYTATILPFEEVNVAPSSPGRIDEIYVEVGDRITTGQKLFLMDRTMLYQQKVQMANLAKDLARMDTLLKTGSIKQQQYDQLKTQYDVTKTNVDFMEENTLLTAPFTGIVTGKYFENGEVYSGTPTTATGRSAVVTVMQVSPLKVNVSVSEQYYPLIKKGMKAEVTADVYRGELFNGTVFRIYPTINSATRSFIVELELPNKKDLLKPGMFVRVSMDLGEVETFVVPAASVLLQEGTNIRYVFVNEQGVARRVEVAIGKRFDDQIEISSNVLKEGTSLITEGQSRLLEGNKVNVVL